MEVLRKIKLDHGYNRFYGFTRIESKKNQCESVKSVKSVV